MNSIEESLLNLIKEDNIFESKNIILNQNVNFAYKYNLIFQTVCEKGNIELFDLLYNHPNVDIEDMANAAFEFVSRSNNKYIADILITSLDIDYHQWFTGLKQSYANDINMLSFIFYHERFKDFRERIKKNNLNGYTTIIKKIKKNNIVNF